MLKYRGKRAMLCRLLSAAVNGEYLFCSRKNASFFSSLFIQTINSSWNFTLGLWNRQDNNIL